MNSLHTVLLNGLIEDRIRAAAEARLPREYQREHPRAPRTAARRRFPRLRVARSARIQT